MQSFGAVREITASGLNPVPWMSPRFTSQPEGMSTENTGIGDAANC